MIQKILTNRKGLYIMINKWLLTFWLLIFWLLIFWATYFWAC